MLAQSVISKPLNVLKNGFFTDSQIATQKSLGLQNSSTQCTCLSYLDKSELSLTITHFGVIFNNLKKARVDQQKDILKNKEKGRPSNRMQKGRPGN